APPPDRRRPLFAVSRKTAWLWMQQAIDRVREEGIEFALPAINPKTLRHSFAMHLFFNHVPPKVVQAHMGHERYESTEVYLKVFALDVAPQLGVTFSLDHRDYSHLLTRK
ncbi:phage integrase family protein, partial [Salmonella enterica]|nr:phage integrase family protein [Salmonella enterica]